ncbi:hypothetical protein [Paludisphaera rhizosphaerae]|uniref:hypothetical protein n=1 Tax=Paludisphaera rhizosphaerae TaxID=2711216 RepID=UPI0013ECB6B2|nr:hypothetical protein [Paludisphaera rhizosphaerae]
MEEVIMAGHNLREIVSALRQYQRRGVTRQEIQLALEALRDQARDEAMEDRILEVMDIVSGFCSQENTVWDS